MKFILTSLYVILLQNSSKQHYIPPLHHCLLATFCNHTGIPMCGIEKEQLHKRIFLDDCDMFEYNCDNHKAYGKTELSDCTMKETESVVSTITTQISTITTARLNLTTQNTVTDKISTSTISSETEPPTTIPITSTKSSSFSPKTENISKVTESTFVTTTKKYEITKTPISTDVIDPNCTRVKDNKTTNLNIENELTKNLTKPMSTMSSTQSLTPETSSLKMYASVSTVESTTTAIITTLSNVTPTPNTSVATIAPSKTTEYIKINDTIIAGNQKNVSSSTRDICDKYPKTCDRPHTWETTVKGETRDFFQILKARFGSRVKVLRDTTHFPQHQNISINYLRMSVNEDNESFHYGKHNEG